MRRWAWILAVLALAGCDDEPKPAPAATAVATAEAAAAAPISGRCPVTIPDDDVIASAGDFNHGSRRLAVYLWPRGRLVADVEPNRASWAEVRPDGSIYAKVGWWRGVEGQLRIEGERIDGPALPLRAEIPEGYGPTGFQATALIFPSTGCWRVVGTAGDARLEFVSLVRKRKRRA